MERCVLRDAPLALASTARPTQLTSSRSRRISSPGKTADGKSVNGKITIPNLSEENAIDEVDVR
jgi:hypothetical protein